MLYYNYIWLIGIGIIMLLMAVVAAIDSTSPLPIMIAITIQEPNITLDMKNESQMLKWSLLVELFNVLKSCIYIVWFFYSNHLTKQRKVKEMTK